MNASVLKAGSVFLASLALATPARPAAVLEPDVVLENVTWTGELSDEQAVFTLDATARVTPRKGGSLELLAGTVALVEVGEDRHWSIRADEGRFVFQADRAGRYPLRLKFQTAVEHPPGWNRIHFRTHPGALQRLMLRGLAAETQFQFPGGAKPERDGEIFTSYLPLDGGVNLAWKEASREAEGRLFYAAEGLAQVSVSPGLLRQTVLFVFKVMQGEMASVSLDLVGEGEITRVQGEAVLAWKQVPGEAGRRRLEIAFNQPQKDTFALILQTQTPLGVFPLAFEVLQLRPTDATRFTGYCRVVNDGAVRLEVLQAAGLSQVSPEQFPVTEAFKALGLAEGSQTFAYRFSSGTYALRVQADNILPELGVSELVTYHLGETELTLDAEFEIDVREAPLRELTLSIPTGFVLARLNAPGISDYFVTEGAGEAPTSLRVVYGAPVSGRQVVQLRLERNEPFRESAWKLPRIEVTRAKSTRGHVGVTADAGYRLTPTSTHGLTDIATAFFPRKTPGLQAAFRLSDPAWEASLTVERLAQSIQTDGFHLFSVAEGIAYGSSVLNYVIAGAPISSLRVELADEYFNVEFTGREIRNWQKVDGGYLVQLHTPVSGPYTLLATYERPFKAQGDTLTFTGARPLDAQSEQGHTLVISAFQFEVQPVNVSSNLLALEPGELPAEYRLFFDAPVLAAFRYSARPFNLQLQLHPLVQGETMNQVVDRASLATRISEAGEVLTDAQYFVKSKGATHFRVVLPTGSALWSATVNGRPAVPVVDQGAQWIPLPQQADPNAILRIDLKLAGRAPSADRLTLAPPAVAAPVLLAEWRLQPDAGHRLQHLRGALAPQTDTPDATGFGAVWRMFTGPSAIQFTSFTLAILVLVLVSSLVLRAAAAGDPANTGRVRQFAPILFGVIATAVTLALCGMLSRAAAGAAVSYPTELSYLIPVQQAGSAPSVEIANRSLETTWSTHLESIWPAVLALVVWVWSLVNWEGGLRRFGVLLGWVLLLWATLRAHNGAPATFLALGAYVVVGVFIPGLRKAWRPTPPSAPAAEHASGNSADSSPATALPLAVALGALLSMAPAGHATEVATGTNPPPVLADAVIQTVRVEDGQAHVQATIRWQAQRGAVLALVAEPAVVTALEFPDRTLERVRMLDGERRLLALRARRDGDCQIQLHYQLPVTEREGQTGLALPTRPALVQQLALTLVGIEADVTSPAAVSVQRDPTGGTNTVASLVLGPAAEPWVGWKPRARDTRREQSVFYVEVNHLFVPTAGVLDGLHVLHLRPAQGELAELTCDIPAGVTITDVAAPQLATWRFDPDARRLRMAFSPAHNRPFSVRVLSQLATGPLPYETRVGLLTVSGAASQIGLAALGTGNEVQLEAAEGQGFAPINLEDFPQAAMEPMQSRIAGLAVRRAFRFADRGGTLTLKAAAVEPDVRVESQQTLSLGEDRVVLAANLGVDITRAGIFRLSFALPESLDVETITGPALSHWTELKTDADRTITLHLKGKTEGHQTFTVTLSGPGLRSAGRWAVPRLALREAAKQQGQLLIVPEQGMRLQVGERDGLTQLDPARSGVRQKGVLAFRLLQETWKLGLDIEQVDAWIQVTSLQDAAIGEGQVRILANLQYEIENTGVKSLRVALPAAAQSVRFTGDQVADFLPVEGGTNATTREWEVKLHRRVIGKYGLQLAYQQNLAPQSAQVDLQGVQALDANLQRGFLTLRALGRLQLRTGPTPAALQLTEWQSIPRSLQSDVAASAANMTFRLVEPAFDLPVTLERREAVKLLPAKVQSVQLTSVVSDSGVMLTQARVELTPGDKRLLHLRLPDAATFWFAFVNQASVWPWRQTNEILVPLETHSRRESTTVVEFFYSLPLQAAVGAHRSSLDLALTGPRFDLPLENVSWRVFLNRRWELAEWDGTLQLAGQQLAAAGPADPESYIDREQSFQEQQMRTAESMLQLGNRLLEQGDPQEARRAFERAYGLSQRDNAFNEDARVQLHNLKMQQAIVGLNARQALVANDTASPANRLRGVEAGKAPAYTQQEAKEILDRNSAEDNAVQLRLAERLVQQQDAALPNPAAIRASIPESGRLLLFSRSLLVDPWADLHLNLEVRSVTPATAWRQPVVLAALAIALGLLGWAGRPRRLA